MKKRILALILSMMMIASSLPVQAAELEDISVLGESIQTDSSGVEAENTVEDEAAIGESADRQENPEGQSNSGEGQEDSQYNSADGSSIDQESEVSDASDEDLEEENPEGEETPSEESVEGVEISEDTLQEDLGEIAKEPSEKAKEDSEWDSLFTEEWLNEHGLSVNDDGLFEYVDDNGQLWTYDPEDPEFWKYFVETDREEIGLSEDITESMLLSSSQDGYTDPFTCPITGKKYSYPKCYKTTRDEDRVQVRYGLDVSKYQGSISLDNWRKLKNDYNVDFAFIRAGFRGYGASGSLNPDGTFTGNLKNAHNAGLKTGVYFFSQAITEDEARAEADYCLELTGSNISLVDLPIIIDYEYTGNPGRLRAAGLSDAQHTAIVNAFCARIRERGYRAGIYANKSMFSSDMNFSDIESENYIWMAHWPSASGGVYSTDFGGRLNCWQFTDAFTGFGTKGNKLMGNATVDLNFWYDYYPNESREGIVSFEANGGTGEMEPTVSEIGDTIILPECSFTKAGFYHKEWNTRANGTGTAYAPGDEYTIVSKSLKLYAVWDYIEYKLTFDPAGGEVDVTEKTVLFNGKPYGELPVPKREGFRFLGWCAAGEPDALVSADTVLPVPEDQMLVANWEKIIPSTLSLSYDRLQLEEGKTGTIKAIINPQVQDANLIWESTNEDIAIVSEGRVTAVRPGKTTITARIEDSELSASCEVTVFSSDLSNDTGVVDESFEVPDGIWLADFAASLPYTGAKQTPQFKVYYGNTLLRVGTDYSISYKNNVNAGTATAIVQGKGSFAGKAFKNFTISPLGLKESDVEVAIGTVNRGKPVKPAVTVTCNGKVLKLNKDYTLDYEVITTSGTANVTVTGKGNYENSFSKEFYVKDSASPNISKVTVTGLKKSYTFDEIDSEEEREAIKGAVSLTYKKEPVNPPEYSLSLENAAAVGKGTLVITPANEGPYVGVKKVSFNITGNKLGSLVLSQKEFIYNGISQTPEISVFTGKKGTGEEIDSDFYSVSYSSDTTKPGTVTITVIGNASMGYTGKLTARYKISALSVADAVETGTIDIDSPDAVTYTQGGVTPSPLVTFTDGTGKKWTLREGVDYTVKYANNKSAISAKEPSLTITGKGNFKGKSLPVTFGINKRNLSSLPISCKDIAANAGRKGSYYYSKPVIYDVNGKLLKEKTDYTLTFAKASGAAIGSKEVLRAGTIIIVTIKATEKNYTGQAKVYYRVTRELRDISKAAVRKIENRMYTGKPVEINDLYMTYTTGSGKNKIVTNLEEGKDFVITGYYNNTRKGTATLRVEGIGDYTGCRLITFKIVASQVNNEDVWKGAYKDGILVTD